MTDLNLQIDRVNASLDRLCDRYKNLSDSIGYLQIKPCSDSTPTAMTDGFCITFNPEHVEGLSQDQLDSLMMHEILHIIDWHFIGSEDKDPYLWNLSCDFRVNSILLSEMEYMCHTCLHQCSENHLNHYLSSCYLLDIVFPLESLFLLL